MPKKRINVYIDGFNLYHSTLQHTHPDCRWLNLLELSKRLINPETEEIQTVCYFSALTTWIPERAKKHLVYIHALRTVGVKDILGKFSTRERKCPLCTGRYLAHEEKKTDINITLLGDAVADKFDTALILSGDSDLAPVTTKLKQLCPDKKIGIIVPKGQSAMHLKLRHLQQVLLSNFHIHLCKFAYLHSEDSISHDVLILRYNLDKNKSYLLS